MYEGVLTMLDGGALRFDLKSSEGGRSVPQVARLELESGGHLRARVWSLEGAARTLTLDVEHRRLAPSRE